MPSARCPKANKFLFGILEQKSVDPQMFQYQSFAQSHQIKDPIWWSNGSMKIKRLKKKHETMQYHDNSWLISNGK